MLSFGLGVMEQLIIKALKSACGNRHFKFQVIVHNDQLHIYVNYRPNYQPNQSVLEENVGAAIASLDLNGIEAIWLYGRPLTQTEPEWQTFVELPAHANSKTEVTNGNKSSSSNINVGKQNFSTDLTAQDTDLFDRPSLSQSEINELYSDPSDETKLDSDPSDETELDESSDLMGFEDFEEADSVGDTGLLHDTGLVHGGLLKEAEIDSFAVMAGDDLEQPWDADANPDSPIEYCFISDRKLLTDTAPDPDRNIMRMVKFVHHLSESDRHQLLSILNSYFQEGITPGLEDTLPAIQNWFEQLKALPPDRQDIFFIWLSRYCFNPTRTLEEFQAITAQNAAEMDNRSRSATEYSLVNVKPDVPSPSNTNEDLEQEQKWKISSLVKKALLPILWSFVTIILILLGIMNHNSNVVVGTAQAPPLCDTSIGSKEYCRLGVNLAGGRAIAKAETSLFPMTEITEAVADYGCARYTNLKAGIEIANIAPEINPVISVKGEKIFPHIYVVRTEQKYAKRAGNIKVGCVYTTGQGQRSPKKLAADIIPIDWPTSHYQKSGEDIFLGIYASPINLGLYTIFAAIGMAIASWLNLGLQINRTHTIYLAALMLGIVQLITALLPSFGLFAAIVIPILTILAASFLLKDFRLNWSRGYPYVAISVLVIIAVQFSLYSLCLGLINSFV